ncbi:MAG: hypothetical protein J0I20_29715 [Chloroflexi bacterium]|nr:hypothetical protein [Chloroflexota bacterium]OJV95943.1 MAG: hypothetical protein BGO39_03665 [Chloroflexi bacterium 54-19]
MSETFQVEPGGAKRPDFKHLERLYRVYGRFAFGLAVKQLGTEQAEDVVHEAFLRFWREGDTQGVTGPAFFSGLLKEVQRLCQVRLNNPGAGLARPQ